MAGATVWFPVAEGARGELAEALRDAGASVTVQHIYRSVMPESAPGAPARRACRRHRRDHADQREHRAATSSRRSGAERLPAGVLIVCIGEQTAADARAAGLTGRTRSPRDASVEGLVRALTECLAPQPLR